MIVDCNPILSLEASKLMISLVSISLSLIFLIMLKKINFQTKSRIALIYSHLLTLLFPMVFLTTNAGCASVCASCYTNVYQLLSLAIPSTLVVSTALGFFVIPVIFIRSNKQKELAEGRVFEFVKASSKKMKIKQPKIYTIDKSEPVAFSFRNFKSAVFLSIGLFDILKWKEVQAVILHELAHISQKSSALKLSTFFLRIFSPMSVILKFHHNDFKEEKDADHIAAKIQGTDKFIKSARKKIMEYQKN